MRRVTCKDCHRSYDYDKDDFCPRCGTYNSPVDNSGSTQLEQDLLSRFGDGRANQSRAKAQQAQRSAAPTGRTYQRPGGVQWRPGAKPDQGHGNHTPIGQPACEEETGTNRNTVVSVLAVVLTVAFAVLLVGGMQYNRSILPVEPSADLQAYSEPWRELGEPFPLGEVTVSVDDVRWVDTAGTLLEREGWDLLLVDVWVEGGGRYDPDARIASPTLALDDGTLLNLEPGADLARRVRELEGSYVVDLRDYQWEDPLSGAFAFYVPQGETHGVLQLLELEPMGEASRVVTLNQVDLALPALPGGN